jgi:CheY-like chemotaxis protein
MTRAPRRILVLDGDPAIRQFLFDLLTEEGHRVETVGSVSAAHDVLARWQPDLLVADPAAWHAVPGELPALLNADAGFRRLPVVVCIATVSRTTDVPPAHAPGLELLTKPFSVDDLLAAIDRLVARRGEIDPTGGGAD